MTVRPTLAIALAALLACAACGRRGALEGPGGAVVAPAAPVAAAPISARALPQSVGLGTGLGTGTAVSDPNAVRSGDELAPSATAAGGVGVPLTTTRGARRGYRVPDEPFGFIRPGAGQPRCRTCTVSIVTRPMPSRSAIDP